MTTQRSNPEAGFGTPRTPELQALLERDQRRNITSQRRAGMLALSSTMPPQAQRKIHQMTLSGWVNDNDVQGGMRRGRERLQTALTSVSGLPEDMQGQWEGRLNLLISLCQKRNIAGTDGDPIAIVRSIEDMRIPRLPRQSGQVESELSQLQRIGGAAGNAIHGAIMALREDIGPMHPAVLAVHPQERNRNPALEAREGHAVRSVVFIAAMLLGIGSAILACFAKEEDRNLTLPLIYLGIAALAYGWGDITATGSERLARQLDWVVDPGGTWQRLRVGGQGREGYGLTGQGWAQFIETLYTREREDAVVAVLGAGGPYTPEQRTLILEMAPASVRAQVERMLTERSGEDFRALRGCIFSANTPSARSYALTAIREGATPETLARLGNRMAGRNARPVNT